MAGIFERFKSRLSLRAFMRVVEQPYWRLRDHLRSAPGRQQRWQDCKADALKVNAAALDHPTYGYRPLYHVLRAQGDNLGRERLRQEAGRRVRPAVPRRRRRPVAGFRVSGARVVPSA